MLGQLFMEKILNERQIAFHPERCLHSRYKRSLCQECACHCPAGAVKVGEKVSIDRKKCKVCGICTSVCPTQSLVTEGFSLRQWLNHISPQEKIIIVCDEVNDIYDNAKLPCLGMLHEEVLASIILSRQAKQITLNASLCRECPKQALNHVEELPRRVQKVSAQLGTKIEVNVLSVPQENSGEESATVSRREFFGFFRRRLVTAVADVLEDKFIGQKEEDALLPERRYILNALLEQNGQNNESSELIKHLFPQLQVADGCDACLHCARICPTGALVKAEDEAHFSLAFKPNHCVGCNLCVQCCPQGCLSEPVEKSSDYLGGGLFKTLRKLPKTYCYSCNKPFAPVQPGTQCETCKKEADIEQSFTDWLL
ncbi:MAG: 4Fe-4S binding protein [Bacillota bacterium]